jgi:hypothetical protein
MKLYAFFFCFLTSLALLNCAGAAAQDSDPVDFNGDIRPILSHNCFACHGPDENERKASLRLDIHEGILADADSGEPAVVPGNSSESLLYQHVSSADPDIKMPPPDSGKSLSANEINLLKRWIEEGAQWKGHWSFNKPEHHPLPEVKSSGFVKNPIDQFILARLEQEGLSPAKPADKITLLRRVTFDLTGLPPTLEEIDAFLADNTANAYEQVVDRLLNSERFGEHMARYWLDIARYGDTHGLHFDNERALWKYRDWVVDAFNNNKPYDQFTIEQLAGDLLPEATLDQKIATGFNRCNVTTSEGGSINDEVLVRYAVDRTETMSTVFLGLTLGCAVCHDHKFDPVTQKEFYQLFAFYNSAADAAMDGNALAPPPIIKVAEADELDRLTAFDQQIAEARQKIPAALASFEYSEPEPLPDATDPAVPQEFVWIDDTTPANAALQGDTPWEFVGPPDHPVFSGEKATKRTAAALSQHFFTGANPGLNVGDGDKLFAYVYLDPQNPPKTVMLQFNDGSWEHRAFWGEDLIPFGAGGNENHLAMGPLPKVGEWVRLEVEASRVGVKSGAVLNGWAFTQHAGTAYWDKAGIVTRTPQNGQTFESLVAWAAYDQTQATSTVPQPIRDAIKLPVDQRTAEQQKQIRDYFLENIYPKSRAIVEPIKAEIAALEKQRADFDAAIPVSLIMADLPQPRETFVLIRGEYDQHGEKVSPGVPASLPPLPADVQPNRLGMAKWLTDPSHPLTARVAVNRYWQQLFGTGIVKTAEDFGAQGEWPSHPQLLDWLALDFVESGWDVKRSIKQMLMSATYQQASDVTPELLALDPENRLLARGSRFRLDAETVRDAALFTSGLLVEKVGGRSVRPYQPSGLWEAVAFRGSNTEKFTADTGEALYRRSVYTFWKRTSPPPALMAFDAPSRETCVARRARTNTPMQALVLMNDEQYVEASRNFAQRAIESGGTTANEQINYAFRLATSRLPTAAELEVLTRNHAEQLQFYQGNKEAATQLISVGESKRNESIDVSELAAMTMVTNLIFNLDESISKE